MSSPPDDSHLPVGADDEPEQSYTITELAEATGVPERTIRFYRESGLIDPPTRDGRHAYYAADQLPRVRLIAELRELGLALEAIGDLLRNPDGRPQGLAEVLRITDELRVPWTDDAATRMSEAAVLRAYGRDDPEALPTLEANGVIQRNPGRQSPTYTVPSIRTLQLAGQLIGSGVDADVVFTAWHIMQDHLADMSHEIIELFVEYASRASSRNDGDPNLEANFGELQRLGLAAVQLFFAKSIERELEAFVERGGVLEINRRRPIAEAVRFTPDDSDAEGAS